MRYMTSKLRPVAVDHVVVNRPDTCGHCRSSLKSALATWYSRLATSLERRWQEGSNCARVWTRFYDAPALRQDQRCSWSTSSGVDDRAMQRCELYGTISPNADGAGSSISRPTGCGCACGLARSASGHHRDRSQLLLNLRRTRRTWCVEGGTGGRPRESDSNPHGCWGAYARRQIRAIWLGCRRRATSEVDLHEARLRHYEEVVRLRRSGVSKRDFVRMVGRSCGALTV